MEDMSTFSQVWKNFEGSKMSASVAKKEMVWLNELNQAIFTQVEKRLPRDIKVRVVNLPAFTYYVEACGGYGVENHTVLVSTYNVLIEPNDTFEEQVEDAVGQIMFLAQRPYYETSGPVRTVYFYTPLKPMGTLDLDGSPQRRHMGIRLRTLGETVDVAETK